MKREFDLKQTKKKNKTRVFAFVLKALAKETKVKH